MTPILLVIGVGALAATLIHAFATRTPLRNSAALIGGSMGCVAAGLGDWSIALGGFGTVAVTFMLAGSGAGIVLTPLADPNRVRSAIQAFEEGVQPDSGLLQQAVPSYREWLVVVLSCSASVVLVAVGLFWYRPGMVIFAVLTLPGSVAALIRFKRFEREVEVWTNSLPVERRVHLRRAW